MKNFNFGRLHWKIRLLRGEGSRKTNIYGGLPKKGGLDSLFISGGLGKKEGDGVFERGGWYPNAHYVGGVLYKEIVSNFASNIKPI